MIFRDLQKKLEKELKYKEITVITGMRRTGKTTLLRHLFNLLTTKNKIFIDLENILNRKIFEEINYENIVHNLEKMGCDFNKKLYIFLDEIQFVKQTTSVTKYLYDHYNVKFVITGSSSFYLKNLFAESLAGRKLIFELFPLNFSEFLHFKGLSKENNNKTMSQKAAQKSKIDQEIYQKLYYEYMMYGGFPDVVLQTSKKRKKDLLLDIFNSYFQKDVYSLFNFAENSKLRDLILLITSRVGSTLEITKLASVLEISREKIYQFLQFLSSTYFITLVPKFTSNIDRSTAGKSKVFFCDTGLLNVLGQISKGKILENSVFQNLRTKNFNLTYYRKNSTNEIDLILDKKIALEIKLTANKADIYYLNQRIKALKNIKEHYVISSYYSEYKEIIMAWDLV